MELVDTMDLGSIAYGRAGSSPVTPTKIKAGYVMVTWIPRSRKARSVTDTTFYGITASQ